MSPNSIVNALVVMKSSATAAVGDLHALHYHWDKLDKHERAVSLASAKRELERALVAVMVAEKEITSESRPEPSNIIQIGDHDPEPRRQIDVVSTIMGGGDAA